MSAHREGHSHATYGEDISFTASLNWFINFCLVLEFQMGDMTSTIPNLKLNNGVEIPALGFGTFANVLVAGETHAAVLAALDAGYRHLDCAW
jgi:hypothetical protein